MKKYFIHFTQYYNYLVLINYKLFILEIKYIYLIKCIIKKFNIYVFGQKIFIFN